MRMKHRKLEAWVEKMARLCEPARIVWMDGTPEEKERLEKRAVETGELIALDPKKRPGSFYYRSAPNDVARTEQCTYVCTRDQRDAGPTNNWMSPEDGYRRATEILAGAMRGRTMYVIPFSMGPVDSPFAKLGVQLTDSVYVALSMRIMTRVGDEVLRRLGARREFTRCVHSTADLRMEHRFILHFPQDNAIWSVGSGYGGNALLGKKCLSLRLGSYLGWKEGWLAEHMLIMGIEDPQGRTTYVAAAFPSACGKTNLAMLVPPEPLRRQGYKIRTIGDDIAWLRPGSDGRLWAINPEAGYFGVAPGTNSRTNPNAVAAIGRDTIFTNVLLTDDGDVWWEGADGPVPASGTNWEGRRWQPGLKDADGRPVLGAHPNSRFTTPVGRNPSFDSRYGDRRGVPLSAIIFGGRRARVTPLVFEARNWDHGVFAGATMASERTAAQTGKTGEVRRDPMAMLPFCGYNMADYFAHWLEMGRKLSNPPRIFNVNWFKTDATGRFLWPGFGENLRVLLWMIGRCQGQVMGQATPAGIIPRREEMELSGLEISAEDWRRLFDIDTEEWRRELDAQSSFFDLFGGDLPEELRREQADLRLRIALARAAENELEELRPAV